MPFKSIKKLSTVALLGAMLGACGGGGGNATSSVERLSAVEGVAVDLSDESKASKVAANTVDTTNTSIGLGQTGSSFSGIVGIQNGSGTGPVRKSWSEIGTRLVTIAIEQAALQGQAISAATRSENCSNGGTLSVNYTQQNSNWLNTGDRFSLSAQNCSLTVDGETVFMNGVMNLSVLSGSNVSPSNLTGVTLGFEMLPLALEFSDSSGSLQGTVDGGFKIRFVSSSAYQLTLMNGYKSLTQAYTVNGTSIRETLSDFDFTVTDANATTSYLSGKATLDTTRINALGATRYSWATADNTPLAYNSWTDSITGGVVLLASQANSSRVRLSFGQSCESTSQSTNTYTCVLMEKDSGTGTFVTVNTYTWSQFSNLQ